MKNSIIIMVGIPGSGKSTEAKKLLELLDYKDKEFNLKRENIIVSSDEIRKEICNDENCQTQNEEVFKVVHKRIKEGIKKGNVIVDATNITIKNRRAILNCVKKEKCIKIAYVMTTPIPLCKKYNSIRERKVPDEVIDKMAKNFQIPFYMEGFDSIILSHYSSDEFKDFPKVEDFKEFAVSGEDLIFKQMLGFDQKNSHHKYTLDKHCLKVYDLIKERYPDNRPLLRASIIHDIGKIYTGEKKENSEEYSYKGHMGYGTYTLLSNLDSLGLNDFSEVLDCLFYINYHMEPFFWNSLVNGNRIITNKTKEKMIARYGEDRYNILLSFNECDKIASGTSKN